jgi:hypothetical protein
MGVEARTDVELCRLPAADEEQLCPRCGAEMFWTKASWHCADCRYKEGCCG